MVSNALPAYNWLAANGAEFNGYAGKWVAVVEGKMLGAADSVKKLLNLPAVKNATKNAENPLITKIPQPEEAQSLL